MGKPRLLIVDDSVVVRRGLAAALASEPGLIVAGAASSGRTALMKIPLLQPDVVALDIAMADPDGLSALAEIRQAHPHLPVIVMNLPTDHGASATVEALSLGAKDYVTKPEGLQRSGTAIQILADELASKISSACDGDADGAAGAVGGTRANTRFPLQRVDVVVIGVSTGGPSALTDLLPIFPSDFPVPILVVQHMPSTFTRLLAERLDARCQIRVQEGRDGEIVRPGRAWIAPGDFHMAVERDADTVRLRLQQDAAENSCRPAADVLFRSAADVYGAHVLAVVMTGMGRDGLSGCQYVYRQGGRILVQDEASSVVWGMPRAVMQAGIADRAVPLDALAGEIAYRVVLSREPAMEMAVD